MLRKPIVGGIILLFLLSSFIPTTYSHGTNNSNTIYVDNDGTLSGYVKDTSMNPIEGARVRVNFHDTYEENYTDSSGYYRVTNIPICYCIKNATASKEGYRTEWILFSIDETTIYNFVLTPIGKRLYVGGNGPNNYTRIQDAIGNANDDDRVFVYDDSSPYIEHLTITKSIIITGENKETTKIYGNGEDKDILFIKSNGTTVSNFTIQYGSDRNSGILIKDSSYATISDCKFFDIPSMDAITISNSENITIVKCLMSDSIEKIKSGTIDRYISGITLEGGCYNTTISGNTISNASYAGIIVLEGCNNTRITSNYINSNDKYGIRSQYCNYTYIEENLISKNQIIGIAILGCYNTFINRNSCENNDNAGVGISDSVNSHIESNNFIHNGIIGYFSYNFGEGFANIFPDIIWEGNYWDRTRIFPKPIFGTIAYQKDSQSPLILIPWVNFDFNPAKEPYDIPILEDEIQPEFVISAVRYNEKNQHIVKVRTHMFEDGKVKDPFEEDRETLLSKIRNGTIYYTINKKLGRWVIGSQIKIIKIKDKEYLRTDNNDIESDNLENLPEF